MTVVRQRIGKPIPEVTLSTVGSPLLGSRSVGTFRSNGQNTNNSRGIHELFEVVVFILFAWKLVQSQGILHSAFVRKFNDSVCSDSSFVFRHSRREDTRSPVRNGASLRQSLIVSCYNWLQL
jgi:hypothetical protein